VCKIGDLVRIEECAPISKRKTWTLIERNGANIGGAEAENAAVLETVSAPAAPAA
jgi:small subunit ribosomal protein S17